MNARESKTVSGFLSELVKNLIIDSDEITAESLSIGIARAIKNEAEKCECMLVCSDCMKVVNAILDGHLEDAAEMIDNES